MYVVYSKQMCNACTQAKLLLENENYEHVVKMLGVDFDIMGLYEVAPRNHKSFPCITKLENGIEEYIGGLRELQIAIEKGLQYNIGNQRRLR